MDQVIDNPETMSKTMSSEDQSQIRMMVRAKSSLESISSNKRNAEWNRILTLVNEYLEKHCSHCIVDDLVDISPESSMSIRYCVYCEKTF